MVVYGIDLIIYNLLVRNVHKYGNIMRTLLIFTYYLLRDYKEKYFCIKSIYEALSIIVANHTTESEVEYYCLLYVRNVVRKMYNLYNIAIECILCFPGIR